MNVLDPALLAAFLRTPTRPRGAVPYKLLGLGCGLLALIGCGSCPGQVGTTAFDPATQGQLGPWSAPVNGLRARLRVYPADTDREYQPETDRVGAYARIEVEFENVSDRGNPIEFRDVDDIFAFTVRHRGAEVERYDGSFDEERLTGSWLSVPWRGVLRRDLTTTGWGFNPDSRAMIVGTPGPNAWAVPYGDTRDLLLSGRMTVPEYETPASEQERLAWSGELVFPAVLLPKNRPPEWRSEHDAFSEHLGRIQPGWSATQLLDYAGTPDHVETQTGQRSARWFYSLAVPPDLRTQTTVGITDGVVTSVNTSRAQLDFQ